MATTPSAPYRVSTNGVAEWSERHADAWIGLLETHKQLTRALDAELESRYGLSLSGLELLARLAASPDRCLRLSALAAQAGLSLSRVSRIAVTLETRGLIQRTPCERGRPRGRGASHPGRPQAHARGPGNALRLGAGALLRQLRPGELETLAAVFGRFSPRAADACTVAGDA